MTIAMSLIYLCSFKLYCSTSPSSPPGFQCELLSQFCAKQLVVINTGKLSLPVISVRDTWPARSSRRMLKIFRTGPRSHRIGL